MGRQATTSRPVGPANGQTSEWNRETAFAELDRGVYSALETYSNVHRGTGHYSLASTTLFERARDIVLEHLDLDQGRHEVVFCTPWRAEIFRAQLAPESCSILSSSDFGLPLGLRAVVAPKSALPRGTPFQTGGGTIRMVSPGSVVWSDAPDRFEAGTPNVVGAIAFAKALLLTEHFGADVFRAQAGGAPVETAQSSSAKLMNQDEFAGCSGRELLLRLRESMIGRGLLVPTACGQRPYVNLDNAASTPALRPVWDVVCQVWRQPEAVGHEIIRDVRKTCSRFLGAPLQEYDVIFTSNATEALNVVAQNLDWGAGERTEPVVLNTVLEHHSNELPWRYLPHVSLVRLPVDDQGFVDLGALEGLLRGYNSDRVHGRKRIVLVALSGASNVLGSLNDTSTISRIAHDHGAQILVDGAQLVAHRRVDMEASGIDYLTFSAHKIYAPFGGGALVARKRLLTIDPAQLTEIKASGEENVVGIAALGKAMTLLERVGMDVIEEEERALTRRILDGLSRMEGVRVYGVGDAGSPRFYDRAGVISFSFSTTPHNLAARELAERHGIGVRNGCFCAHITVQHALRIHPIRILVARLAFLVSSRLDDSVLPGMVRVSLGIGNGDEDIDVLLDALRTANDTPRCFLHRFAAAHHNGAPLLGPSKTQGQMLDFAQSAVREVFSCCADLPAQRSPDPVGFPTTAPRARRV